MRQETNNVANKRIQMVKGTPQYMAPENLIDYKYSMSNDVFAFSILVYEVLTLRNPYPFSNLYELVGKVAMKGERSEITLDIPYPFQKLQVKCWNENAYNRPTFQQIVNDLKTNQDYINECIDETEYYDYIDFIENSKTSFELEQSIRFKDLSNAMKKNKLFRKVNVHKKSHSNGLEEENQLTNNSEEENREEEEIEEDKDDDEKEEDKDADEKEEDKDADEKEEEKDADEKDADEKEEDKDDDGIEEIKDNIINKNIISHNNNEDESVNSITATNRITLTESERNYDDNTNLKPIQLESNENNGIIDLKTKIIEANEISDKKVKETLDISDKTSKTECCSQEDQNIFKQAKSILKSKLSEEDDVALL